MSPPAGPHADALAVLRAWRAPSAAQEALRRRYLAHLTARPDGLARSCAPEHITTSLVVLDASLARVLLTLHAKSGRWFQLGGHVEPADATLAAAAWREGIEESGLGGDDLDVDPEPLLLDAHAVPFCGSGSTWHLDVMFGAVARAGAQIAPSSESLDLAWWAVDDLPDAELAPFVTRARARAADRGRLGRAGQSRPSTSSASDSCPGGGCTCAAADQPSR